MTTSSDPAGPGQGGVTDRPGPVGQGPPRPSGLDEHQCHAGLDHLDRLHSSQVLPVDAPVSRLPRRRETDLRAQLADLVFEQGHIQDDCAVIVGSQIARAYETMAGEDPGSLSVEALFRSARDLMGEVGNGGVFLWTVLEALRNGTPPESTWPYSDGTFDGPVPGAAAAAMVSGNCFRLRAPFGNVQIAPEAWDRALSAGFTLGIGVDIYRNDMSDEVFESGEFGMPGPDQDLVGSHAIWVVGHNPWFYRVATWGHRFGREGFGRWPRDRVNPAWVHEAVTIIGNVPRAVASKGR